MKKLLVVLATFGAVTAFAAPASAVVTNPGPGLIISCPGGAFAPGQGVQDDLEDCA